jgi:hypothetical protein
VSGDALILYARLRVAACLNRRGVCHGFF